MVNQDAAHDPCAQREEMNPVLKGWLGLEQPQVSLVDQGRGGDGYALARSLQVVLRNPAQLGFHQENETLKRTLIALCPGPEQHRNLLNLDCHRLIVSVVCSVVARQV